MTKALDLTGQRFGRLVAEKRAACTRKKSVAEWWCRCDCGNKTVILASNLVRGMSTSCGCWKIEESADRRKAWVERRKIEYEIHFRRFQKGKFEG